MTHGNIYEKFLIEYDKDNITSSYPSLTPYEIATLLDRAYNALLAQKVTGNNIRRAGFESDIKSISDIANLIITKSSSPQLMSLLDDGVVIPNVKKIALASDFLYFVEANLKTKLTNPYDKHTVRMLPILIVDHKTAEKFYASAYNMPWIKIPVGYIEGKTLYVVYDSFTKFEYDTCSVTYIKLPKKFVDDDDIEGSDTEFECNDTVAEELISLAISFALENVESPRLNSKLNMRGLEA